jgi:DNA repair protein RadC
MGNRAALPLRRRRVVEESVSGLPPSSCSQTGPSPPTDDAPRARRARWLGVDQLDTDELLGLVVGRDPRAVREPAHAVGHLPEAPPLDLLGLSRADPAELAQSCGLRRGEATRLAAAFALGRRLARFRRPPRAPLRSPDRVARLLEAELSGLHQESFHVLALDGRHALLARFEVSRGTLTTSLVHPREVFRPAIARGAAAVIAVHNHPSGDPEPSAEDLAVTRRLLEAGRLLGIPLLDHVVIGAGRFVSLQARMDFEARGPP